MTEVTMITGCILLATFHTVNARWAINRCDSPSRPDATETTKREFIRTTLDMDKDPQFCNKRYNFMKNFYCDVCKTANYLSCKVICQKKNNEAECSYRCGRNLPGYDLSVNTILQDVMYYSSLLIDKSSTSPRITLTTMTKNTTVFKESDSFKIWIPVIVAAIVFCTVMIALAVVVYFCKQRCEYNGATAKSTKTREDDTASSLISLTSTQRTDFTETQL